jgi:hypothetical protein
MGRGYSGNHPRFSHRQDERYDAKEAYNKDLTASARLHYLENDRHDHESPAHSHCSPMHNNRAKRLRDRAIRISERSGAERGDEYDYENPTVMDLLKKANELDERSNKKIMPKVVTQAYVPNDERSGEIRNEMIDEMIDYRPDSPMNEISKRGERIINQADKGVDAYLENNTKKADRHFRRAKRIKKRDDKRHSKWVEHGE